MIIFMNTFFTSVTMFHTDVFRNKTLLTELTTELRNLL